MALSAPRMALRARMGAVRALIATAVENAPNARDYTCLVAGQRVTDQERLRAAHDAWQTEIAALRERLRDLHRQDVFQNACEREAAGEAGAVDRARAALAVDQERYAHRNA